MGPLDPLLSDGVLDEVLGRIKSGKEADIYLVRHRGVEIAAKVYKDRDQRSFKNNADYKEGRDVRSSRTRRAIESGSRFGRASAEQEWKSAESDALHTLYANGVRVPEPVMFYEGVLLMQLVLGEDGQAAPRYIDVSGLETSARAIYLDLRSQIVRMLCCEIIHGDLSPYNILAGVAGPTIIDFPQIISAAHNSRAEYFFLRDFQNVLDFFAGADRSLAAFSEDGRKIWRAYGRRDLSPDFIPTPPSDRLPLPPRPPPTLPPRPPHTARSGPPQTHRQRPPQPPPRNGPPRNGPAQPPHRNGPPPSQNRNGPPPSQNRSGPPPPPQRNRPPQGMPRSGPPPQPPRSAQKPQPPRAANSPRPPDRPAFPRPDAGPNDGRRRRRRRH